MKSHQNRIEFVTRPGKWKGVEEEARNGSGRVVGPDLVKLLEHFGFTSLGECLLDEALSTHLHKLTSFQVEGVVLTEMSQSKATWTVLKWKNRSGLATVSNFYLFPFFVTYHCFECDIMTPRHVTLLSVYPSSNSLVSVPDP